ncbi:MAG: hypothetical protein H8E42_12645 [Nitrospinae bacterium]|nr:hypothetical protein [Nitrospinota bacterium]MBL7021463.1 hypothetical protein [Nitrospinaceae bacterium]
MQRLIWITIFLMTFSLPAWAQESLDNAYCSDYHSARVKIVSDSSARKLTEASMTASGRSVIRINLGQLNELSNNARSFAVNFSCGRLVLGHLVKGAEDIYDHYDQVGNADCWAAGKLFYSGRIDKNGVTALEEEINQLNREQWSHFPGPVRVVALNDTCELKPLN